MQGLVMLLFFHLVYVVLVPIGIVFLPAEVSDISRGTVMLWWMFGQWEDDGVRGFQQQSRSQRLQSPLGVRGGSVTCLQVSYLLVHQWELPQNNRDTLWAGTSCFAMAEIGGGGSQDVPWSLGPRVWGGLSGREAPSSFNWSRCCLCLQQLLMLYWMVGQVVGAVCVFGQQSGFLRLQSPVGFGGGAAACPQVSLQFTSCWELLHNSGDRSYFSFTRQASFLITMMRTRDECIWRLER